MPSRRRQRHCFAPGCDTGYKWAQGEQPSLFAVPKDEAKRKVWERNLHRKDKVLDESCSVCEWHFEPSYISRDYVHIIDGKEVLRIPRGKPELLPDAVPTLLPNAPGYLSKKTPKPRAPRKRKNSSVCCDDPKRVATDQSSHSDAESEVAPLGTSHFPGDAPSEANSVLGLRSLDVPSVYWSFHDVPDHNGVVYCKLTICKPEEVVCERAVIFTGHEETEVTYTAHLYGSIVKKGTILSREQAVNVLFRTDSYRVCTGALPTSLTPKHNLTQGLEQQVTIRNGTYYNKKCSGKEQSEGQACVSCRYTRKALQSRKSTQIIGCFATRGNAKAELLAKILIEATVLAEASGLLVDFITCDGASWNRRMWKILGIGVESGNVTCKTEHPVDPARHLHFLSDFPHLIKCVRNTLLSHPLNTPKGMVSIQPLREAFKIDSGNITLKVMPGLTLVHLQPNGFEKMRVTLAFQLLGDRVLHGLNFYKDTLESSWGEVDATLSFFT
ncbi:hypothetical protein HPB50_018218 [Hyalomma asiaticum]|uniref:Uncharacterized protein n=1 Tax=Hyalomma asiaticum TaxID=266040 RepID=A0ACB7T3L1_HYAAI|nr:hypothetical protein HPB50_018218 [Hyalomma asiaticum]